MKKKLLTFAVLLLLCTLSACSGDGDDNGPQQQSLTAPLLTSREWKVKQGNYSYTVELAKNHTVWIESNTTSLGGGMLTGGIVAMLGTWEIQGNRVTVKTLSGYGGMTYDAVLTYDKGTTETLQFTADDGTSLMLHGDDYRNDRGTATVHDAALVGDWKTGITVTSATGEKSPGTLTMTLKADGSGLSSLSTGKSNPLTWSTAKGSVTLSRGYGLTDSPHTNYYFIFGDELYFFDGGTFVPVKYKRGN